MSCKKYKIDEYDLIDLRSQVAAIEAFLKNGMNVAEIQKRLNILYYLLSKIESKSICRIVDHVFVDDSCAGCGLTKRAPDAHGRTAENDEEPPEFGTGGWMSAR